MERVTKFAISAVVLSLIFWKAPEQAATIITSTGAFVLGRSKLADKIGI